MVDAPFAFADQQRVEQFGLIGSVPNLMSQLATFEDEQGVPWGVRTVGQHRFGVTWLGPNSLFDQYARDRNPEDFPAAVAGVRRAGRRKRRERLEQIVNRLKFGQRAERLLWAVHHRILVSKRSVMTPADAELAAAVWGNDSGTWPKHWRRELSNLLRSLARLHVGTCEDFPSALGADTALLTHFALLRRRSEICGDDCPFHHERGHRHFLVNVGRGFLGILEQFASEHEKAGVRTYDFPVGSRSSERPSLWRIGKTGRLMSVYLPAKLGSPDCCKQLTAVQHRLLQAVVRETTRRRRNRRPSPTAPEIVQLGTVPDLAGRRSIDCDCLDRDIEYVAFSGNGKRRACGYRLFDEYGWLRKAGYSQNESVAFLSDLSALVDALGLIVAGLTKNSTGRLRWLTLDDLRMRADERPSGGSLQRTHLRIYTKSDYEERWGAFFQPTIASPIRPDRARPGDVMMKALVGNGLAKRALAHGIGRDYSCVGRMLSGKRPCDEQFVQATNEWIRGQVVGAHQLSAPEGRNGEKLEVVRLADGLGL